MFSFSVLVLQEKQKSVLLLPGWLQPPPARVTETSKADSSVSSLQVTRSRGSVESQSAACSRIGKLAVLVFKVDQLSALLLLCVSGHSVFVCTDSDSCWRWRLSFCWSFSRSSWTLLSVAAPARIHRQSGVPPWARPFSAEWVFVFSNSRLWTNFGFWKNKANKQM